MAKLKQSTKMRCLVLLVRTSSAYHARHGLQRHVRARVDTDEINYAMKYATEMKPKFYYCG